MKSAAENWWNMARNRKLFPDVPKLGEILIVLALALIAFKFSEEFKLPVKVAPDEDKKPL